MAKTIDGILAIIFYSFVGYWIYRGIKAYRAHAKEKADKATAKVREEERKQAAVEQRADNERIYEERLRDAVLFAYNSLPHVPEDLIEGLTQLLSSRAKRRLLSRDPDDPHETIMDDIALLKKYLPPQAFIAKPTGALTYRVRFEHDPDPKQSHPLDTFGPIAFYVSVPIPISARIEHHWVCAKNGWGKSSLVERFFSHDLIYGALQNKASIIIIDSQRKMFPRLTRMGMFKNSNRLIYINPQHYTPAINIFKVKNDPQSIANAVNMFNFVIDSLLERSELTGMQDLILGALIPLLARIPDATVTTFLDLLESTKGYERYIAELKPLQQKFLREEYLTEQYRATRLQVSRRIWQIINNPIPTISDMFTQPDNKIDITAAINEGKVILIDTAKSYLGDRDSAIFGAIFIGLIYQATMAREDIDNPMPCFVYIDEAQEYVKHGTKLFVRLLEQARKYNVGMVILNHFLAQLPDALRFALSTVTSIKMVGGLGEQDVKTFASMFRCDPEFIDKHKRLSFATHVSDHPLGTYPVKPGHIDQFERLTDEEYRDLLQSMKDRYAVATETPPKEVAPPPSEHDDHWRPT